MTPSYIYGCFSRQRQQPFHPLDLFKILIVTPTPFLLTISFFAIKLFTWHSPRSGVSYSWDISPLVIEARALSYNECAICIVTENPNLKPIPTVAWIQEMKPRPAALLDLAKPVKRNNVWLIAKQRKPRHHRPGRHTVSSS